MRAYIDRKTGLSTSICERRFSQAVQMTSSYNEHIGIDERDDDGHMQIESGIHANQLLLISLSSLSHTTLFVNRASA